MESLRGPPSRLKGFPRGLGASFTWPGPWNLSHAHQYLAYRKQELSELKSGSEPLRVICSGCSPLHGEGGRVERWSQTDPGTSFGSATCRVASGKVHHLSAFSFEMGSTVSASRCSVVRDERASVHLFGPRMQHLAHGAAGIKGQGGGNGNSPGFGI